MSNKQLHEELRARNIKVAKAATKDVMLGKLGVPSAQWKVWRKMKAAQLKQELKKQGKAVSGTKEQLLDRLGVPKGYGETSYEKTMREFAELERADKKRRKEQSQALGLLAATLKRSRYNPEDDPTHQYYTVKCCDDMKFRNDDKPEGAIFFPDGSLMEVGRCLTCGKFPTYPNAPPIMECSSDDEDGSANDGGDRPDCVIQ